MKTNVRQTPTRFLMGGFGCWANVFLLIQKGATCYSFKIYEQTQASNKMSSLFIENKAASL